MTIEAGESHRAWKTGIIIRKNGYRCIRVNGAYMYEHRYVVERQLGRKLLRSEIVHHIDHNRLNNDPSNLVVMDKKEHDRQETLLRHSLKASKTFEL
jgi:hypothetical protein